MSVLAVLRPNDWDFPLFLHVLGATVLVGGLVVTVAVQLLAWRRTDVADVTAFTRAGFWALVTIVVPGWLIMRLGGQWIYSKEGWSSPDPDWLGIGFTVADIGLPVLVITVVLAGLGVRQLRRSGGTRNVLTRIALPLATLMLVAYVVAIWAMTAKPS
jgi:hypothetical protein